MDCCVWVDVLVFKCAFRAAIAQASSLVCLRHNLGLDVAGAGGLSLGWGSVNQVHFGVVGKDRYKLYSDHRWVHTISQIVALFYC